TALFQANVRSAKLRPQLSPDNLEIYAGSVDETIAILKQYPDLGQEFALKCTYLNTLHLFRCTLFCLCRQDYANATFLINLLQLITKYRQNDYLVLYLHGFSQFLLKSYETSPDPKFVPLQDTDL